MQPLYNCAETYIQVSLGSDLFIGKECLTGRRSFALRCYGGPKLCDRGGRLLGIVKILHKRHSHSCDCLSKSRSKHTATRWLHFRCLKERFYYSRLPFSIRTFRLRSGCVLFRSLVQSS